MLSRDRFSSEDMAKIKQSMDIVEIIGNTVDLHPNGTDEHKGLCPFHEEKTASFTVNSAQDGNFFYCHGCHVHGDVIDFISRTTGEAIGTILYERGLSLGLVDTSMTKKVKLIDRMHIFFQSCLAQSDDPAVLDYLKSIGLSKETAKAFGLGLSPKNSAKVLSIITKAGYSINDIDEIGMLTSKEKYADRRLLVEGRIVFPVHSLNGSVVAFNGRSLSGTIKPKYVHTKNYGNSKKQDCVFFAGGHGKSIVVVEGATDSIAMKIAGFDSMSINGSKLHSDTAKFLARKYKSITLIFDGDSAGYRCTKNALMELAQIIAEKGCSVYASTLPAGEDPSCILSNVGVTGLVDLVSCSQPLSEIAFEEAQELLDGNEDINGIFYRIAESECILRKMPLSATSYCIISALEKAHAQK